MSNRRKFLQVEIDKEREKALENKADELGLSKSDLIRKLVDENCNSDIDVIKEQLREQLKVLQNTFSRYLIAKVDLNKQQKINALLDGIDTKTATEKQVINQLFSNVVDEPDKIGSLEKMKGIFCNDKFVLTCIDNLMGGINLQKNVGQKSLLSKVKK